MHRLIVSALMLAASMLSWAQTADSRVVAYVQNTRNTNFLVLANQDGSQAATVYSTKKSISEVDFAPGGGRIAFSEVGVLKVVAYTETSSGVTVTSVNTLVTSGAGGPDFSPDGSRIIYVGNLKATEIAADGSAPPRVLMDHISGVSEVAWFGSGDRFVYLRQDEASLRYDVRLVTLDAGSRDVLSDTLVLTTDGSPFGAISGLDVARTRNSILVTLHYPTTMRVVEYNLDTLGLTDHVPGMRAHFSADDSRIVFVETSRSYVSSRDIGSGTTTRLTKKGSYLWADARP